MQLFRYYALTVLMFGWLGAGACTAVKNTAETVEEATVAAGKEVGDKAEDVADKTADVAEKAAEKTTDATITSAIKVKLMDDDLVDADEIDVDTDDGYVTLTGNVASDAARNRAIEIARGVAGVKAVQSRLIVISNRK